MAKVLEKWFQPTGGDTEMQNLEKAQHSGTDPIKRRVRPQATLGRALRVIADSPDVDEEGKTKLEQLHDFTMKWVKEEVPTLSGPHDGAQTMNVLRKSYAILSFERLRIRTANLEKQIDLFEVDDDSIKERVEIDTDLEKLLTRHGEAFIPAEIADLRRRIRVMEQLPNEVEGSDVRDLKENLRDLEIRKEPKRRGLFSNARSKKRSKKEVLSSTSKK